MEKITVEDIHETAKKHIHPENVIISIAGNAERIFQIYGTIWECICFK